MVDEVRPPTALVISQAYVPHPASVGNTWPMRQPIWSDTSRLQQEIATKLEQPDSKLSDWHGDSLVSKFNRTDSSAYKLTDGAFGIAAAPLINVWGFGSPGRQTQFSASERIQNLLETCCRCSSSPGPVCSRFVYPKQAGHTDNRVNPMRPHSSIVFAIVITAMVTTPALATEYWIAPDGDDRAAGTSRQQAWASPSRGQPTRIHEGYKAGDMQLRVLSTEGFLDAGHIIVAGEQCAYTSKSGSFESSNRPLGAPSQHRIGIGSRRPWVHPTHGSNLRFPFLEKPRRGVDDLPLHRASEERL